MPMSTTFQTKTCASGLNAREKDTVDTTNADSVHAIIKHDNIASIKVAERIGMHKKDAFVTHYYNGDMVHFLYSVHK